MLVAPPGIGADGYLEIDVRRTPTGDPRTGSTCTSRSRSPTTTRAIASTFTQWAYAVTQSRIHVLVTYGFLRSLAKLDLEESKIGRFADIDEVPDPSGPAPSERSAGRDRESRAERDRPAAGQP